MAYLLIAALNEIKRNKGEVIMAKDAANFGRMERLPGCLRLEVTGATAAQVMDYQNVNVRLFVQYTVVAENAQGWRTRMKLDPTAIAVTGADATFKQEIKAYILDDPHEGNWTATQFAQTATSLTVDIAKGQTYDLQQIKADVDNFFVDRLEQATRFKRYRFPDSDMDTAIAAGVLLEAANEDAAGNIPSDLIHYSITKAQATSIVIDRLA